MTATALRHAFLQLPASDQASLLDDLILSSSDAVWEERVASEMEARVSAVEAGSMRLHEASAVFQDMRSQFRA